MTNLGFYKKWQFKKECYDVSVKRKGSNSYVGGRSVQLYFSNKKKYKVDTSWITAGSKFTVYGEVIEWSKYTWDGYNDVSVVARYIERSWICMGKSVKWPRIGCKGVGMPVDTKKNFH